MPNAQLSLIASAVLFLLSLGTASFGAAPSQDVMGGASLIFIARPKNPPVRPKSTRAKEQQPSQPNSTDKPTNSNGNPAANGEMSDEVEDALALGNSARDAEPPRYQDAEKAYRLATKLNDRDPRPYLGLANLWYDQKNYEAAAKMYREATERMKPKKSLIMGAFGIKTTGQDMSHWTTLKESGEAHAYLGSALLQARMFVEAEAELRTATFENSKDAQLYALLGYSFFQQKKYEEATEALKKALEILPGNEAYKQLLDESIARQQHN